MTKRNRINREPETNSIFYDLSRNAPGTVLPMFPLHLSIVPSFVLRSASQRDVWDVFTDTCKDFEPIPLARGDEVNYGRERVPVTEMIDVSGNLENLHYSLVKGLEDTGCEFVDKKHSHSLDNFTPHVSHKYTNPFEGAPSVIDSLTFTKRLQIGSNVAKIIIASVELGPLN